MAKKIVILNGSPRPTGNTSALTARFKAGAEASGNQVTEFQLSRMKINGCLGCWRGGKDIDHPCTQRDDMEQIYPVYREADVVVLASPLYYWFISGFLKNAFDRLFAIAESGPNTRNPKKECVLIMAAEGAGFEESEHWYDHLEKHIGWKSIGKILCGWVTQPGDIEGKPELEQAYELGKSIH
ncbi:MAG: flavodoxin family protein [Ruminococcaceae bacterium]|nr:flavodoxin family protein [Oscillospiraceae bacterium]